jgi:hypothetical protein
MITNCTEDKPKYRQLSVGKVWQLALAKKNRRKICGSVLSKNIINKFMQADHSAALLVPQVLALMPYGLI